MASLLGFVALAILVATSAFWVRRMQAVNVPRDRRPVLLAMGAAALLGLLALWNGAGWLGGGAGALALFGGAVFLLLSAMSRQRAAVPAVTVGGPILDFTAPDDQGRPFELASLRGRPFLLKFFRGHW